MPVFAGLPKVIVPDALRNLGAQLNTSGAYGIYHIVGFAPKAPALEGALGSRKPKREETITSKDLKEFEEKFSDDARDGNKVDPAFYEAVKDGNMVAVNADEGWVEILK